VASGKLISPFPKRVEFSPTGDRIVTISNDFSVHLWDAGCDNQIARLGDFEELPRQVVFSPDGQRFVIVTQDSLAQLWDASVGRLISVLKTESVNVVHAAFSPNGKLLGTASSDYNNTAHIWKALDGQFIAVLQGHEGSVKSIIFSSDGQRVLTCSEDNTTRMWSALSGKQLTVFEHHSANVERSEFSPNGRWVLSISDDSTARVWDSNSAQLVAKLSLPLENILRRPVAGRSLSLPEPETHFSSDSRCVIASVGGMAIQTWELLGAESSPPAWFSEFLRLLAQRKFDAEGNLVLMPTDEFMSTRSRVTRIVAKERSRYAAIARWFLASTEDRPARPAAN
jgi:WD40 repeat protein